jgi:cation:H+ antiporter
MTMAWLAAQFVICALLIARAGFVLSRSADQLAELHGWGRGWVGLALLATVTSLPELASGISAVVVVDAPNLAVGNVLGACVVNLAFLAVVDALQRPQPMFQSASATHLLSTGFGALMIALVAMSLLSGTRVPAMLHVGLYSPFLLGLYLLALRSVHAHERHAMRGAAARAGVVPATEPRGIDARDAWWRFGIAALVVVAAGVWLPQAADGLAQSLGLSRSFVGTTFMAVVTTLPEMAVTLSALRIGALDMAIGNLLGSNLFNVLVLALDDVFYTRGPLLADADTAHVGTALTVLLMSGLVIIGLVMRPRGRVLRIASWVSVGLVAICALNGALLYLSAR